MSVLWAVAELTSDSIHLHVLISSKILYNYHLICLPFKLHRKIISEARLGNFLGQVL